MTPFMRDFVNGMRIIEVMAFGTRISRKLPLRDERKVARLKKEQTLSVNAIQQTKQN